MVAEKVQVLQQVIFLPCHGFHDGNGSHHIVHRPMGVHHLARKAVGVNGVG